MSRVGGLDKLCLPLFVIFLDSSVPQHWRINIASSGADGHVLATVRFISGWRYMRSSEVLRFLVVGELTIISSGEDCNDIVTSQIRQLNR